MADETDAAKLTALAEKSNALRKDFEERHAFWIKDLPESPLKETLAVKSYRPAVDFFDLRDKTFIPAVLRGERAQAQALMRGSMYQKYEEHRAAIDEVVAMATQRNKDDEQAAADIITRVTVFLAALGVGIVLLASLCSWGIARGITQPMAVALRVAEGIAAGELNHTIRVTSRDETGRLMQAMQTMREKLQQIVGDIRAASSRVSTAASEIVQGNSDLSQRTQEQASALEKTASSMEQMTSTVKQNADNARQANQLAASTSTQAEEGGKVVSKAVAAMADIGQSSKKIADITSVIDGIAFQTNLLALNAAVEAARAGEQGRGFAVVAAEVRKLAQRSAEAAKDIKTLIVDSVDRVEGGTRLVDESGKVLGEIVTAVKKVSDIVAEIAAASQEQSAGIEQVNKAVMQMDEMTQQNAALVEEAAAASEAVDAQAQTLQQLMEFFEVTERTTEEGPNVSVVSPVPRALCKELTYDGVGNCVEAVYVRS
jgi:methyl-accepting chemotaxis protein